MLKVLGFLFSMALAGGLWWPSALSAAEEESHHCPAATPQNTHTFFGPGAKPEDEKRRLDTLAGVVIKQKTPVCILALTNPKDLNHSKKLAIRRVLWARDNLGAAGVPPNQLSAELRPAEDDADKAAMQSISLILGR
ncbi:MAG TPA: hypothetical protein HPQ04_01635 [Rhodospirillaceae bacterium]|nr:hypothetical protein [Rhodospirillaceae bacterium]